MPGASAERHVLHQLAIAADQAVGRDSQLMDLAEIGMSGGIQLAEKEVIYPGAAKLSRRQADTVHHQQGDIVRAAAFIVMGGWHPAGLLAPAVDIDGKNSCRLGHRLLDSQWKYGP
ncbi:hypothetical protein D3C85_1276380 [compost metagenome]